MDFYQGIMDQFMDSETLLGRELRDYDENLTSVLDGGAWCDQDPQFGDNTWPIEELGWLRIMLDRQRFYQEIQAWLCQILSPVAVAQLIDMAMKSILGPYDTQDDSGIYNASLLGKHGDGDAVLRFSSRCYYAGDVRSWARDIAWYGRKQSLHKRKIEELGDVQSNFMVAQPVVAIQECKTIPQAP